MKPNLLFEHLIAKKDLSSVQMQEVMESCLSGQLTETQTAVFLALMRVKGETVEELTTCARLMQQWAHPINLGADAIDIVGTGGDGANTFNISTACSFVVAASGIPVAKHGNRSVSSASGSADVLEQAGFILELSESQIQLCFKQCNLAFLFAPHYHPAMKQVKQARQELGVRTLFNLLGPLINPARVKKQLVGVCSNIWMKPLAEVLAHLGSEHALVVNAQDGLDEISIVAPTDVIEYKKETFKKWQIIPQEYGFNHSSLEAIQVNSPKQSLEMIQEVLSGKPGAARDIVLLNSAAAIYCGSKALNFASALNRAKKSIDTGKAWGCFKKMQQLTQTLKDSNNE